MWGLTDVIISGLLAALAGALVQEERRRAVRRHVDDYLAWLVADLGRPSPHQRTEPAVPGSLWAVRP